MKLVVQIPCLNEEETLPAVIADIRRATAAMRAIILVIDDGSTDRTREVALAAGADFVAVHPRNAGLAQAWLTGLAVSVNLGADVVVNTDADNQYVADCIPDLIAPILAGQADIVVGARPIATIEHFSPLKKWLQAMGSRVLRYLSKTDVADAPSGFRALSRNAAIQANVLTDYTYTLETLIQAGNTGLRVASVPIRTNGPTRPSRLIRSMRRYVILSARDMIRISTIYGPRRSYWTASVVPLVLSGLLCLRFVVLVTFSDPSRSHAPSLIFAATLAILGFLLLALGVIGELLAFNRRLLEDIRLTGRLADAAEGRMRSRTAYSLIAREKVAQTATPGKAQ
jgi:glycosyltransferase involved in cell wall biosynthesis